MRRASADARPTPNQSIGTSQNSNPTAPALSEPWRELKTSKSDTTLSDATRTPSTVQRRNAPTRYDWMLKLATPAGPASRNGSLRTSTMYHDATRRAVPRTMSHPKSTKMAGHGAGHPRQATSASSTIATPQLTAVESLNPTLISSAAAATAP